MKHFGDITKIDGHKVPIVAIRFGHPKSKSSPSQLQKSTSPKRKRKKVKNGR